MQRIRAATGIDYQLGASRGSQSGKIGLLQTRRTLLPPARFREGQQAGDAAGQPKPAGVPPGSVHPPPTPAHPTPTQSAGVSGPSMPTSGTSYPSKKLPTPEERAAATSQLPPQSWLADSGTTTTAPPSGPGMSTTPAGPMLTEGDENGSHSSSKAEHATPPPVDHYNVKGKHRKGSKKAASKTRKFVKEALRASSEEVTHLDEMLKSDTGNTGLDTAAVDLSNVDLAEAEGLDEEEDVHPQTKQAVNAWAEQQMRKQVHPQTREAVNAWAAQQERAADPGATAGSEATRNAAAYERELEPSENNPDQQAAVAAATAAAPAMAAAMAAHEKVARMKSGPHSNVGRVGTASTPGSARGRRLSHQMLSFHPAAAKQQGAASGAPVYEGSGHDLVGKSAGGRAHGWTSHSQDEEDVTPAAQQQQMPGAARGQRQQQSSTRAAALDHREEAATVSHALQSPQQLPADHLLPPSTDRQQEPSSNRQQEPSSDRQQEQQQVPEPEAAVGDRTLKPEELTPDVLIAATQEAEAVADAMPAEAEASPFPDMPAVPGKQQQEQRAPAQPEQLQQQQQVSSKQQRDLEEKLEAFMKAVPSSAPMTDEERKRLEAELQEQLQQHTAVRSAPQTELQQAPPPEAQPEPQVKPATAAESKGAPEQQVKPATAAESKGAPEQQVKPATAAELQGTREQQQGPLSTAELQASREAHKQPMQAGGSQPAQAQPVPVRIQVSQATAPAPMQQQQQQQQAVGFMQSPQATQPQQPEGMKPAAPQSPQQQQQAMHMQRAQGTTQNQQPAPLPGPAGQQQPSPSGPQPASQPAAANLQMIPQAMPQSVPQAVQQPVPHAVLQPVPAPAVQQAVQPPVAEVAPAAAPKPEQAVQAVQAVQGVQVTQPQITPVQRNTAGSTRGLVPNGFNGQSAGKYEGHTLGNGKAAVSTSPAVNPKPAVSRARAVDTGVLTAALNEAGVPTTDSQLAGRIQSSQAVQVPGPYDAPRARIVPVNPLGGFGFGVVGAGWAAMAAAALLAPAPFLKSLFPAAAGQAGAKLMANLWGASLLSMAAAALALKEVADVGMTGSPTSNQLTAAVVGGSALTMGVLLQAVSLRNPLLAVVVGGLSVLGVGLSVWLSAQVHFWRPLQLLGGVGKAGLTLLAPRTLTAGVYSAFSAALIGCSYLLWQVHPGTPNMLVGGSLVPNQPQMAGSLAVFVGRAAAGSLFAAGVLSLLMKEAADRKLLAASFASRIAQSLALSGAFTTLLLATAVMVHVAAPQGPLLAALGLSAAITAWNGAVALKPVEVQAMQSSPSTTSKSGQSSDARLQVAKQLSSQDVLAAMATPYDPGF